MRFADVGVQRAHAADQHLGYRYGGPATVVLYLGEQMTQGQALTGIPPVERIDVMRHEQGQFFVGLRAINLNRCGKIAKKGENGLFRYMGKDEILFVPGQVQHQGMWIRSRVVQRY